MTTDTLTDPRPLVERLRNADQGVSLGADGMGWSPDPTLYRQAADEIDRLTAALAAASAPGVPAGWRLAPVEPTPDMLRAAVKSREGPAVYKVLSAGGLETLESEARDEWAAMLSASPPPPTERAARCQCNEKLASECDEPWGPNCDLGNNPAFVAGAPVGTESVVDKALGIVREQSEQARPGSISARACEWSQDYSDQWTDQHYGFSIIEDQDDELPFAATWGEGDAAEFATLEEAKAWCQSQVDGWIAKYAVLPGQQSEQARQPLTDEQIEALRDLDTDKRVRFYEHDFYVLSNFSAFTLQWNGIRFDTSEAAYHWEKFEPHYTALRNAIQTAPSAHEAFKLAERNKHCRRPDWDAVKVGIMRDILRAKAAQHEYVRRKLLATGDRELVEDSWRDDFWGWGPNRDGQNMLGRLWMEMRAELRAHGIEPAKDAG